MKKLLAVLLLVGLFPAEVYATNFEHGVQITTNCAGYTITASPLSPAGWTITTYDVSPGPGSYAWNGATSVAVSVWVVWTNDNTGATHTFGPEGPGTIYGYKPGGCTPEEEQGSPPSGSYAPPCIRHVHVLAPPLTQLLWDGHIVFVAGDNGALIEWVPPGQHTITWAGGKLVVDVSADFCGTLEVSLPTPTEEPVAPSLKPQHLAVIGWDLVYSPWLLEQLLLWTS